MTRKATKRSKRAKSNDEKSAKRVAALSRKGLDYFKRLLAKDPLENWTREVLRGFLKSRGLSIAGLHHTLVARASKVLSPEPEQIPPTPGYDRGSAAHSELQSQRTLDGFGVGKKNKARATEQGGNKLQLVLQGFRSVPGCFFTDEGFCGVNATPEEYENALGALIANDAFIAAFGRNSSVTNLLGLLQFHLGFVKIMGGGGEDARKGFLLYHRLIDTSWYENNPCDAGGRPLVRLPMCNVSEVEAVSGNVLKCHRDKTKAEEALALAPEGSSLDYSLSNSKWRLKLPNGKLVDAATYRGTIGKKPAATKRNAAKVEVDAATKRKMEKDARANRQRKRQAQRDALQREPEGDVGEDAQAPGLAEAMEGDVVQGDVPGGDLELQGDVQGGDVQGDVPGDDLELQGEDVNASTLRELRASPLRALDRRAKREARLQGNVPGDALDLEEPGGYVLRGTGNVRTCSATASTKRKRNDISSDDGDLLSGE